MPCVVVPPCAQTAVQDHLHVTLTINGRMPLAKSVSAVCSRWQWPWWTGLSRLKRARRPWPASATSVKLKSAKGRKQDLAEPVRAPENLYAIALPWWTLFHPPWTPVAPCADGCRNGGATSPTASGRGTMQRHRRHTLQPNAWRSPRRRAVTNRQGSLPAASMPSGPCRACAIELTCHRQQRTVDEGGLILSNTGQQEHPSQGSIRQCNAVGSRDARLSATFMTAHGHDSFPTCCRIAEPASGWPPSTARLSFQPALRRERHVLNGPVIERAEEIQEHAPKRADS